MISNLKTPLFSATVLFALVLAGTAIAQDTTMDTGGAFDFYGQVSQGYLGYDDGEISQSYFPVDNDNSGSRIGVRYENTLGAGWGIGGRFEVGITPNSTSSVNLNTPVGSGYTIDKTNIRHLEVEFENDLVGNFAFGQGSMATDGITGIDFSNTTVVAGVSVKDSAASQLLRSVDGTLSGEMIADYYKNLDGRRLFRVRYDTPDFNGFMFSVAHGQDVLHDDDDNVYSDLAGRYEGETDTYRFMAGVGVSWIGETFENLAGSASVLHKSSGLNLTVASGTTKDIGDYNYVKAGVLRDFFDAGTTAFSLDYYLGADIPADGSSSKSVGLAVVQNFDRQNLQLYATYRRYDTQGVAVSYLDSEAFLAGFRYSF
ncbi:porin [Falsihalocynthiibacter sp. CO-5D18]|uniref:porin n=1 Tax=Falsihalocynthiibacter sp. CO-5D18 TaxID=3240872 RepID=UPI00350F8A1F